VIEFQHRPCINSWRYVVLKRPNRSKGDNDASQPTPEKFQLL
jgi:hypothetical protein